jgi:RNA polymerase sigma factor (sigma-70 family)
VGLDHSVRPERDSQPEDLSDLVARFAHRVPFFVRRVERRLGIGVVWRDDLVSAGYWGLLKALRNRRPGAHPRELSAYVSQRIEGAVLDEARSSLERQSRRADFDPFDEGEPPGATHRFGAQEASIDRRLCWMQIRRSLEVVAKPDREILMQYAQGSSVAEIARLHGRTVDGIEARIQRVVQTLRTRSPELRRLLRREG